MSYSDRSTSPDPLARPGSPLAARTRSNIGRRSNKPLAPRSSNVVSPSKSFVMDTGKAGDGSPWRIKVTVEAEPKDGSSPAKRMTRTTTVALKGASSSSPAKKSSPKKKAIAADESEVEIKRPQRKRRGTPIRRSARRSRIDSEETEDRGATPGQIEMSEKLQEELSSPSKSPRIMTRQARQRRSVANTRVEARRNLGDTFIEATNDDEDGDEEDEPIYEYGPGDMTVANEDFTMVSVEELESMKQNTSVLDNSGIEKSVASVSYMPSSPPASVDVEIQRTRQVHYPSISEEAEEAKVRLSAAKDPRPGLSYRKSGSSIKNRTFEKNSTQERLDSEPAEWRLHRQAVSQEMQNASASQVIVIEDDTQAGAPDDRIESDDEDQEDTGGADDLDIWAEEASRSREDEVDQQQQEQAKQQVSKPPQLEDLFSDQPLKPPRPKIPRTWRRTSGMDFSYVDSPEHGALKDRKPSATSTEGEDAESRSGGVLTPPESGDDDSAHPDEDEDPVDDGDTFFTQPDAAATQLQNHHDEEEYETHESPPARNEAVSPLSDSSSSVTSPEGDDTGCFWQNNLPNVYKRPIRPRMAQRQKAMDLSELLNLDNTSESIRDQPSGKIIGHSSDGITMSTTVNHAAAGRLNGQSIKTVSDNGKEKVVSSPLRKSLLKRSKIGGSSLPVPAAHVDSAVHAHSGSSPLRYSHRASASERTTTDDSLGDSFGSHASDQRQLLSEMRSTSGSSESSKLRYQQQAETTEDESAQSRLTETESGIFEEEEDSYTSEQQEHHEEVTQETNDATRSYEERLNVESPQKIRVKFNDSEGNSSALAAQKEYPPLFGNNMVSAQHQQKASPPSVTLVSKKHPTSAAEAQQGIFSRLSMTFWSAVVRPSGPTLIEQTADPEYPPSLRAKIRSRYGVLSDQHPWTMSHMRTLHRLLNSCTSGRYDSVVPKSGPLPFALENLISKDVRCVTEFHWIFTEQHAHVVDAFMQVLVPAHYIEAMKRGEVDFIGDAEAKKYRGMIHGRHGDDLVFKDLLWFQQPKGRIERDYVVKVLGNCVSANILTAEKEAAAVAKRRRIEEERRAWERRNGIVHDEDGEDASYDDSSAYRGEVLMKVRLA